MKQDSVLLFTPHVNPQCPDSLSTLETLLTQKKRKISVQNITDRDIRHAGKTEPGTMQLIKSDLKAAESH